MTLSQLSKLFFSAALVCAAANAATVFTFDSDSLGTTTNFTDTVNGLSASFSSSADPGGFVLYASMYQTLTGNVLGDPGPAGMDNLSLSVKFNQTLGAATLDFVTSDFTTPSPFTLTACENSTLVGSTTASGTFLSGSTFPEGAITFAGGNFDQLVFSSTAADFAIDNLAVAPASTIPEPALPALFAAGLLALGIPRVRSKGRAARTR